MIKSLLKAGILTVLASCGSSDCSDSPYTQGNLKTQYYMVDCRPSKTLLAKTSNPSPRGRNQPSPTQGKMISANGVTAYLLENLSSLGGTLQQYTTAIAYSSDNDPNRILRMPITLENGLLAGDLAFTPDEIPRFLSTSNNLPETLVSDRFTPATWVNETFFRLSKDWIAAGKPPIVSPIEIKQPYTP